MADEDDRRRREEEEEEQHRREREEKGDDRPRPWSEQPALTPPGRDPELYDMLCTAQRDPDAIREVLRKYPQWGTRDGEIIDLADELDQLGQGLVGGLLTTLNSDLCEVVRKAYQTGELEPVRRRQGQRPTEAPLPVAETEPPPYQAPEGPLAVPAEPEPVQP